MTLATHNKLIKRIAEQIKKHISSSNSTHLHFYHGGTNSTREQNNNQNQTWIDISALNHILEINIKEKYALVEPNVSMDVLAKTTLEHGLLPFVVMEFPGITAGGAVNGAALEASSYKYGQFNDTCEEYEVILGNGKIVQASAKKNKDLFYDISGSYGSLGLITLIKIKLRPASQYILTTFTPTKNYEQTVNVLQKEISNKKVDFLDAIIFNPKKATVISANFIDKPTKPIKTFSKATDTWFYEYARVKKPYQVTIPTYDFLFRYNKGAFWMGEYFYKFAHLPTNKLTKFLTHPFMNTRKLYDGLHAFNISQEYFIQDFYVPRNKTQDFLEKSEKNLDIFPIWLCPVKVAKNAQKLSPNYIPDTMLMDIGIWGQSKKYLADPIGMNKLFETYAKKINARKMLYAHAYYSEQEFWKIYDKKWYDALRKKYYADVFPNVWQKTHVKSQKMKMTFLKGSLTMLQDALQNKHINS